MITSEFKIEKRDDGILQKVRKYTKLLDLGKQTKACGQLKPLTINMIETKVDRLKDRDGSTADNEYCNGGSRNNDVIYLGREGGAQTGKISTDIVRQILIARLTYRQTQWQTMNAAAMVRRRTPSQEQRKNKKRRLPRSLGSHLKF